MRRILSKKFNVVDSPLPRFQNTITFPQVDWAGRIFYSRIFEVAQSTMEKFIATTELGSIYHILQSGGILPVVVHAESDYWVPIFLGDSISVEISCIRIGKTSFTMNYDMFKTQDKREKNKLLNKFVLVGRVRVVHVLVKNGKKIIIPSQWDRTLKKIYREKID